MIRRVAHSNTRVQLLPGGDSAYATSEYSLKARRENGTSTRAVSKRLFW